MHDEAAGIEAIKSLPRDGKHHLSHVLRNGLCCILAVANQGGDVEKEVMAVEAKIAEMGL